MDEQIVRAHAEAFRRALLAGDIGLASHDMSPELQRNLGPVVAMLPLPLADASLEGVEMTGTGYLAVLSLVGESGTIRLETRWKERDGKPTMVEASHAAEEPAAEMAAGPEGETETEAPG
jgi:hypothetical protein